MRSTVIILVLIAYSLGGCANPVNRVTSENYAEDCSVAERNGRLDIAEEACYRALVNVNWGNLGPGLKSQRLYNLGRVKRQLEKFEEAEKLFQDSLAVEANISDPSSPKIGRRNVELAVNLAGQSKWNEGAKYLDLAIPNIPEFSKTERLYVANVLIEFSKKLDALGQGHMAHHFKRTAESINEET
ncbi:MAG: tetratricopeptide repeat protein [Sedimenticola sp.]